MDNRKLFRMIFLIIRIVAYILIVYMICKLINDSTRFMCSWNDKYGIICPSCGATRATLSIIKGELLKAIQYNMVYTTAIFPAIMLFILDDIIYMILRWCKITKKASLIETLFEVESGDKNV